MTEKLTPCPFCTSVHCFVHTQLTETAKRFSAYVLCPDCGARSKAFYSRSDAYANRQAMDAWNRRSLFVWEGRAE